MIAGITLTWSDGECYKDARGLLLGLTGYVAVLQLLQNRYQTGCLRRLHSLGQRDDMDVTVEGFSSWMFKGLTFLIPFLIIGYVGCLEKQFQLIIKQFRLSKRIALIDSIPCTAHEKHALMNGKFLHFQSYSLLLHLVIW